MSEINPIRELMSRLPEDMRSLFGEMIASYRQGYADYVYQTPDVGVQDRRIKNLVKNFRSMNYYYVMPLPQDLAEEIADQWIYEEPHHLYHPARYGDFLSEEGRGDRYFVVLHNGVLIGYFCLEVASNRAWLQLGMKPNRIGKGQGKVFYQTIEDYVREHIAPERICLSISSTDQRIQDFFRARGFVEVAGREADKVELEKVLSLEQTSSV